MKLLNNILLLALVLGLSIENCFGQNRITENTESSSSLQCTRIHSISMAMPDSAGEKPLLAIKTNLLFDVASILNIEVEVPIGNRWSVAGEWMFSWWLWDRKQVCFQILSGTVEGRYWLGDRTKLCPLTGWFAGLYTGGGYYDLEWKTKGYQGEFFIAAGLSGGYAHRINKSGTLRMEYSFGIGYMQTKYREYIPVNGGDILAWQKDGRYSWFGPTKAKVSLVWMINHKTKKGGAR